MCIKKGEEIRIDAYISGSPYPNVTWLRNDEDVTKEPTKKPVLVDKRTKGKAKVCILREVKQSCMFEYIPTYFLRNEFVLINEFIAFRCLNQRRSL